MGFQTENVAFQKILDSIRRGGLPIRDSPKWNQFWSTTADGWLFGGNVTEIDKEQSRIDAGDGTVKQIGSGTEQLEFEGDPRQGGGLIGQQGGLVGQPGGLLMGRTLGKHEGEGGILFDPLVAPQPDYGEFDEDMGFVEG